MKLFDKMERKLGRFAIENIMLYIVALQAAVFLVDYTTTNGRLAELLILDPTYVFQGQVWRLITFVFVPQSSNLFFEFFALSFYYFVAQGLEKAWGSFKFNAFYFIGIVGTVLGCFISNYLGGFVNGTGTYLNLSLFIAFAVLYPEEIIMIYFFIPVKIKYLAMLDGAMFAYVIFTADIPVKIAAVVALLNLVLFFGKSTISGTRDRGTSYVRRNKFKADNQVKRDYIHKCAVCGITEKDDPMMDFRYCTKCNGHFEYCSNHLFTHKHKQ